MSNNQNINRLITSLCISQVKIILSELMLGPSSCSTLSSYWQATRLRIVLVLEFYENGSIFNPLPITLPLIISSSWPLTSSLSSMRTVFFDYPSREISSSTYWLSGASPPLFCERLCD